LSQGARGPFARPHSGLDQEVMNLLAESGSRLRSLLVVNGAKQASFEAAEKIASRMGIGGVQPD